MNSMKSMKRKVSIALVALLCVVSAMVYIPSHVSALAVKTIYLYDNTPEGWVSNDSATLEVVTNDNGNLHYIMVRQSDRVWRVDVPVYSNDFTFNRTSADGVVLWNSWSSGNCGDKAVYQVDSNSVGSWVDKSYR